MSDATLRWVIPMVAFAVIIVAALVNHFVSDRQMGLSAALVGVSTVSAVVLIGSICATALPF